jgi:predicted amidophosphoribosyltransferase
MLLLKYEGVARLGDWSAAKPAERAKLTHSVSDNVVPVPLHVDRFRERGYNQADLIARP